MAALWGFVVEYAPRMLAGLKWTLILWSGSAVLAICLGLAIAFARRVNILVLSAAVSVLVNVIRGTPILVQLFLLYYAAPSVGVRLDALTVGLIGLSVYGGAYFSEVFSGALRAVPRGHIEAAQMLGIRPGRIARRLEFPQMLSLSVPSSVNQLIMLMKESAVLSIITVPELTSATTKIVNETFEVATPYLLMACLYWLVIEMVSAAGRWVENWATRHF